MTRSSAPTTPTTRSRPPSVDWFIFVVGAVTLFAVVLPIVIAPQASATVIDGLFGFLTADLGIVYILVALATFIFLLWLSFSKWSRLVLGGDSTKPAYSNFSWAAMLFCTGIGAALIYWGAMEWVYYYVAPPYGIPAQSDAAVTWAASYGVFHWGPIGWSLYCLPAIAMGCSFHLHGLPNLRLSTACSGVLGDYTGRWPGRVIDLLFIFGLLGTSATGLGLGTSVVAAALTEVTGIANDFSLQLGVIVAITLLVAFSVFRGLNRGIRVLSTVNASLALALVAFVFLVGPTLFIMEMGVVALGHVVQNFVTMATWTDPLGQAEFVESWTVFYWAWWIALGPFVGMFVCKISAGRTIRQVIFGMLGWGSLGCGLFFIVLGNFALFTHLEGGMDVVGMVQADGPATAIARLLATLPAGEFWLLYVAVVGLIFAATTYDSAAYTLAAGATRELHESAHPARWHRLFWAFTLGFLPAALLFLGGLQVLQTASIVASLPLTLIYVVMAVSIVRLLRQLP
ncbi:MAG: BCCT family transporter [Pseudomonadota bacterium]